MKFKKIAMIVGGGFVAFIALGALLSALGVEPSEPDEPEQMAEEATEEPDAEPVDDEPEPEPEAERPEITEDHRDLVVATISQEAAVQNAAVQVDGDTVSIALIVNAATNEDEAKRLLDNVARQLATFVAGDTEGLAGPTADSLGELWDHYTLHVAAGPDPDNLIAQGAKVPTSPRITW